MRYSVNFEFQINQVFCFFFLVLSMPRAILGHILKIQGLPVFFLVKSGNPVTDLLYWWEKSQSHTVVRACRMTVMLCHIWKIPSAPACLLTTTISTPHMCKIHAFLSPKTTTFHLFKNQREVQELIVLIKSECRWGSSVGYHSSGTTWVSFLLIWRPMKRRDNFSVPNTFNIQEWDPPFKHKKYENTCPGLYWNSLSGYCRVLA